MKCPVDQNILSISTREGIEIDYCPSCRGVWLDRGELDKLIERSDSSIQQPSQPQTNREHQSTRHHDEYYPGHHGSNDYHKKKSKGSLLGELFDF